MWGEEGAAGRLERAREASVRAVEKGVEHGQRGITRRSIPGVVALTVKGILRHDERTGESARREESGTVADLERGGP